MIIKKAMLFGAAELGHSNAVLTCVLGGAVVALARTVTPK